MWGRDAPTLLIRVTHSKRRGFSVELRHKGPLFGAADQGLISCGSLMRVESHYLSIEMIITGKAW
jgi:hypothetical protein